MAQRDPDNDSEGVIVSLEAVRARMLANLGTTVTELAAKPTELSRSEMMAQLLDDFVVLAARARSLSTEITHERARIRAISG